MKKYVFSAVPYVAVITAMLIWGFSGIAIHQALLVLRPMTLIVFRFTIAVLLMAIIGCAFKSSNLMGLQKIQKKDIPLFLLGGLFQPFLYYILETYTYKALASPTIAETLLSTNPVLTPLFAILLLREKVTKNNIIGILVSTVGMLMLVLIGKDDFALGNPWGLLTAFLAVTAAILYSAVLKRIPASYTPLSIVFYMQAISLVLFILCWCFTDMRAWEQMMTEWKTAEVPLWESLSAVVYLAVLSSVVAFILFCYTVRRLGITRTNAFNNIRPAFTAIGMWLLFDEHLPVGKIIGMVLIITGLYVCQTGAYNSKRE